MMELFQKPIDGSRRLTSLKPGELITALEIPLPRKESIGTYIKKMNRRIWTFASVSIAAQLSLENGVVVDARLVLGGVSSIPWRLSQSEMILRGNSLDDETIERAAEASTAGARPLKHNAYKILLAKGVVTEALTKFRQKTR